MRRGMDAVGNAVLAHFQAIENLVRGRGQLWIAANAITQSAYWGRQRHAVDHDTRSSHDHPARQQRRGAARQPARRRLATPS